MEKAVFDLLVFCSLVIQIRIFRWNYSLNNFRLLRFLLILVCLLMGSIEPNTSAMRQLLHHRSAEYTFFYETYSSITFTWCINIFFLLNTFFFFVLSDFHTFELDFSFSILSIESFAVFWCKLSPNVWLFLMLFPILWMQITVNKFPMCYKRRE